MYNYTLLCIITVEEAQYFSQDMNYYAMVDVVQGITYEHLEQRKFDTNGVTSQKAWKNSLRSNLERLCTCS
jgi:hypothetical protein